MPYLQIDDFLKTKSCGKQDAWYLREAYDNRTAQWSNARFVANWLDKIYLHHAVRCEREDINTEQQLLTLTSEDICLPELTFMQ